MFSSNQKFSVSGATDHPGELELVLKAAMELSGWHERFMKNDKNELVFQYGTDGKYYLGYHWYDSELKACSWEEFPFQYDLNIVAQIIRQYLKKFGAKEGMWDGSYVNGFLVESAQNFSYGNQLIKDAAYAIVSVEPFTAFYAK